MNGPKEPFGYKHNPNTGNREAIPDELRALAQAAFYINQGVSMQAARDWLVKKTGRQISVPGLLKAIHYDKSTRYASGSASEESS